MTTGKNAVALLRKFHDLREQQGDSRLDYERCKALDDLYTTLWQYVPSVELDEAYNGKFRRNGWFPTSLSCEILRTKEVQGLHFQRKKNEAIVRQMNAFEELQNLAQDLDVLFRICIYEDRVVVVLDPIIEQGRGTVEILFL